MALDLPQKRRERLVKGIEADFVGSGEEDGGVAGLGLPAFFKEVQGVGREAVNLIHDDEDGDVAGADFLEGAFDDADLLEVVWGAGVDDEEEKVGLPHFFERGMEGFEEVGRQLSDEAHGVGKEDG